MIGIGNANALTAAGLADFAAGRLHAAGLRSGGDELALAAAECVAPLLRAATIALEISGCVTDEHCAGVRDVIADYIAAPPRPAPASRAPMPDPWP